MYQRKTIDEYQIWSYWEGWEEVCAAETYKEARELLKDYRDNERSTPHKLVKKRIKIVEKSN